MNDLLDPEVWAKEVLRMTAVPSMSSILSPYKTRRFRCDYCGKTGSENYTNPRSAPEYMWLSCPKDGGACRIEYDETWDKILKAAE